MKKLFLISLFCLVFAASYSQTSIEIKNETGIELYGIFSSDQADPEWGDDLLGKTFPNETAVTITFPEDYNCLVDIRVTADAEGEDKLDFFSVDICEINGIILHGNGSFTIY